MVESLEKRLAFMTAERDSWRRAACTEAECVTVARNECDRLRAAMTDAVATLWGGYAGMKACRDVINAALLQPTEYAARSDSEQLG